MTSTAAYRPVRLGRWLVGLIVVTFVASKLFSTIGTFPESLNIGLAAPISDARGWLISNQRNHWLYGVLLDPFADSIEWAIELLAAVLKWIPWYGYVAWAGLGLWWVRGRVAGVIGALAVLYFGVVGVWTDGLDTLALMSVSVVIAIAIGVPIGVASSRNPRVERATRLALDAMQTMPGFVYLIPFTLLFGFGLVPALIATLLFSLPPIARATDLGIRGLSTGVVEAADMFGATERQTLTKVRLPLARPAILVGVNQSINFCAEHGL
ncbi:MAG: ABC transporter permease subunit [Acidimicrobiales bacterium]